MTFIQNYLSLIFIFITSVLYAQNTELEALLLKHPDSRVVNLSDRVSMDITFSDGEWDITKNVVREEIYMDDRSSAVSKESVSYNSFSDLIGIKAYSQYFNGKKYKTQDVTNFSTNTNTSQNAFYDDGKERIFYFEKIGPGTKTRLEYDMRITRPQFLTPIYLQSYYPSEKLEVSVTFPKNVEIGYNLMHLEKDDYTFYKSEKGKLITYTWTRKNVAKMEYEQDGPSPNSYLPQIHIFIKSVQTSEDKIEVLGSPELLHRFYRSLIVDYDSAENENTEFLVDVVDSIKREKQTELEQVESIYNWVQQNINYIAFEYELSGFIPRPANLVCSRNYGDCKDMANAIKYLLGLADIKGYLTWIGTTSLPYKYSELSTPSVDNHMICTYLDENDRAYFLDATDSYIPFGTVASHIQGKEAMVSISSDSMRLITVPVAEAEDNLYDNRITLEIKNGSLIGTGRMIQTGYMKNYTTYSLLNRDKFEIQRFFESVLERGSNNFHLDTFSYDVNEYEKEPFEVNYAFTLPSYVQSYKDELYLDLNLYKRVGEKIKEDRELAYEYQFKAVHVETYELTIPEGCSVTYLPENISTEVDGFVYDLMYDLQGDKLVYTVNQKIKSLTLEKENFKSWNEIYKKINDAFAESIVLKKTK